MRPLRFATGTARVSDVDEFIQFVRSAEENRFDAILIPDHLYTISPEITMATVAAVTDTIKVGSVVFNNDFRHPLILAQQAATLDLFSGGRLELGIGAGWNEPEYKAMGWEIDRPSVRIARMEESVVILKRLFAGETVSFDGEHYQIDEFSLVPPPPQGAGLPIHIGGNGDKLLAAAARTADIIGLTGFSAVNSVPNITHFGASGAANRIAHVKEHAGDRFDEIEFGALVQRVVVTDDREAAAAEVIDGIKESGLDFNVTVEQMLDSPFSLFGTYDEMGAQLTRYRDELGISYFTVFGDVAEAFSPLVKQFAGT